METPQDVIEREWRWDRDDRRERDRVRYADTALPTSATPEALERTRAAAAECQRRHAEMIAKFKGALARWVLATENEPCGSYAD